MSAPEAEVAVVGAGVVGAFVAYHLARAGARAVVLDPEPGGGASAGNAGLLVPCPHRPSPAPSRRRVASALLPTAPLDGTGSRWYGARPMTPGGLPIVREIRPGFVAATGHGQLGMTLAPATGELVAAHLTGRSRI